jgi:hypothetical protein
VTDIADTIDITDDDARAEDDMFPVPEPTAAPDPEAPFGRKRDGTPYKRDPAQYASRRGKPVGGGRRRRSSASSSTSGGGSRRTDYRPALGALVQMVAAPLAVAGQRSPAALADAAALAIHGPAVVEAVNDIAQEQPAVARVLDRLAKVGPYGALLTAVAPLAVQMLVNHGMIPVEAGEAAGAVSPDDLVASLEGAQEPT